MLVAASLCDFCSKPADPPVLILIKHVSAKEVRIYSCEACAIKVTKSLIKKINKTT